MSEHHCHGNGCQRGAHPAMPFCEHHVNMLPLPHKERLWRGRRRDKDMDPCAACDPYLSEEVRLRRSRQWDDLYNLGIAILLVLEYEDCGAPDSLYDEDGFCWGCGVVDAKRTYKRAGKVIAKYELKRAA